MAAPLIGLGAMDIAMELLFLIRGRVTVTVYVTITITITTRPWSW